MCIIDNATLSAIETGNVATGVYSTESTISSIRDNATVLSVKEINYGVDAIKIYLPVIVIVVIIIGASVLIVIRIKTVHNHRRKVQKVQPPGCIPGHQRKCSSWQHLQVNINRQTLHYDCFFGWFKTIKGQVTIAYNLRKT